MSECSSKGLVFNIQRFSLQDGPGIRTTVFFKGCPLKCPWCHNPEGSSFFGECSYTASGCIGCGACVQACAYGAHRILSDGTHTFDHALCRGCGRCTQVCPTKALEWTGTEMTAEEVIAEAERDRVFYGEEGGITLSGGEPMAQPEFALSVAMLAKENGLGVCIETSGYCDPEKLRRIMPFVDIFLFDIKLTDARKSEEYTGASISVIERSLRMLHEGGAGIILRCPLIPEVNTNEAHYRNIAAIAGRFPGVRRIELEPYHILGVEKRKRLGLPGSDFRKEPMSKAEAERIAGTIRKWVTIPVIVS